jgi:hypothetical protein
VLPCSTAPSDADRSFLGELNGSQSKEPCALLLDRSHFFALVDEHGSIGHKQVIELSSRLRAAEEVLVHWSILPAHVRRAVARSGSNPGRMAVGPNRRSVALMVPGADRLLSGWLDCGAARLTRSRRNRFLRPGGPHPVLR